MPGPIPITISVWRPAETLVGLVEALSKRGATPILIVDDGSGPEYRERFARAAAVPGVEVLRHAVRRGGEAALQTAVNHALCTWSDLAGVVAADLAACDRPDEILRMVESVRRNPDQAAAVNGLRAIPASRLLAVLQPKPRFLPVPHRDFRFDFSPRTLLFALAILALLGIEIHGFRSTPLFSQDIWYPVGIKRFTRFIGEFLAIAVPLLALAPWTFPSLIVALLLLLTAISVGPQALLAAAFFLISASALGSRLFGHTKTPSVATDLFITLLGSGVYVFVMTLVARLPVNYWWMWAVLLAIPIALDFRGVGQSIARWTSRVRSMELRSPWERLTFALLAFVLIAQWLTALTPEASADGLAMHLAIPMDMAAHHRMTYEPGRYLWAVMPMGADWVYSIAYLLGGEYAAHILDFAMLLTLVALLYANARRWVTPAAGFLIAASLAATPIVQFVTGSLFVENFLVALVVAMLTAIWYFGDTGDRRFLYLAAVLGGTAMATKYGALVFLVLALPFAVLEIRRHWRALGHKPQLVCAVAVLLLLVTALPTYAIAWAKTGNPVFPFLNPSIHSPLLNPTVLIKDARFQIPIAWDLLYTLTFHTTKAYEGQNGSFGFQYFLVIPLALAGLTVARRRTAMAAMLLALGGGLLILKSTPNVRYLYTCMPLLLIGFASLLGWMMTRHRLMYRTLLAYLLITTALNAWFLPSSSYYHKDFCLRLPFSRAERARYLEDAAPVRKVIAWYNQHHSGSAVLLTSTTATAGLSGDVFINNWHQFPTVEKLRAASTPEAMSQLLAAWRVNYFLTETQDLNDDSVPPMLRALLASCTKPEFSAGGYSLRQLKADCIAAPPVPQEADPARQVVVSAGVYDDFDKAVAWHGDWSHDRSFQEPYLHTISFTNTAGAEVSIAFEGKSLTYVFTKAPNRGIAEVSIDGNSPQTIDLYSANAEWQARYTFCCFAAGRHRAVVRVTGQSRPQSSGQFVDLDFFEVK